MRQSTFLNFIIAGLLALSWNQAVFAKEYPTQKLDRYIDRAIKNWQVPGLAIAVVKEGRIIFSKGYGVRELGKSDPVTEQTIFAAASVTKSFTAASLGMLVDEGRINWDDPVANYLPDLQAGPPYVVRHLSISDMLAHRSGLERGDYLWGLADFKRGEILHRTRYLKEATGFREGFLYNNLMYLAAGQIVPAVTGMSWDDFIATRIFQPLGMVSSNTSVAALDSETQELATPHILNDDVVEPAPWINLDNIGPAGAINSNVRDMAVWLQMLLAGGHYQHHRLLNPETLKKMWEPHAIVPADNKYTVALDNPDKAPVSHFSAYGFGWYLRDYRGVEAVYHGGTISGMRSMLGMMPQKQFGVVVLSNRTTELPYAIILKTFDLLLGVNDRDWSAEILAKEQQKLLKWQEQEKTLSESRVRNTNPSLALAHYTGVYHECAIGDAQIKLTDNELVLDSPLYSGRLEHWHYDTFRIYATNPAAATMPLAESLATLSLNAKGEVEELKIGQTNFKRIDDKEHNAGSIKNQAISCQNP